MSFEISVSRRLGARTIAADFTSGAGLTALIGPSGAGKTTILNVIAGLIRPDRGRVRVAGETLVDLDRRIDIPPQQRRAGYVFQDDRLFPHRTVESNLRYGALLTPRPDLWMNYDEAVAFLDIAHLSGRWPRSLSGGEARRVAIGRALLAGPRFLLLDEPLTSLDPDRREEILKVIERIRDELALPILYVSHDRAEVDRLAGHVVEIVPPG